MKITDIIERAKLGHSGALPPCGICRDRPALAEGVCAACTPVMLATRSAQRLAATRANTPERYRDADLASPVTLKRVTPRIACDAARAAVQAPNVAILGPASAGKSTLAAAILAAMSVDRCVTGRFFTAIELVEAKQECGFDTPEIVTDARKAKILVLDEFGADRGIGSASETIRALVHHRHDRMLTTIFASPFTEEQLHAKYGDGVLRRVFEAPSVTIKLGAS